MFHQNHKAKNVSPELHIIIITVSYNAVYNCETLSQENDVKLKYLAPTLLMFFMGHCSGLRPVRDCGKAYF